MKDLGYTYKIVENKPRTVYKYTVYVWNPEKKLLTQHGDVAPLWLRDTSDAMSLFESNRIVRRTIRRAEKKTNNPPRVVEGKI